MAFIHSKNTVITIDGDDLSNYITESSELTKTTETHQTTGYGLDWHRHNPGLNAATFTVSGTYDSTAGTGPRAVLNGVHAGNAAVEIVRRPEGIGSGLPQDVFDAILTSYVETAPVADMIAWSADFTVTGEVDTTAQSA